MAICVGPPDKISSGSSGVRINGKPAARMGDSTAHGGKIVAGCPTVRIGGGGGIATDINANVDSGENTQKTTNSDSDAGGGVSGLGDAVDQYINSSPTFKNSIAKLNVNKWTIEYGAAGEGSYCKKQEKTIVIDEGYEGKPEIVAGILAHETGHALYKEELYVPPDGLSKDEYVKRNVNRNLKDEGEATLHNVEINREIEKNTGKSILVGGTQRIKYEKSYGSYEKHGDRDKAQQEIGNIFADNERPSTDPSKTYKEYYSKPYSDFYDKNVTK